jgi:hypothetical protein
MKGIFHFGAYMPGVSAVVVHVECHSGYTYAQEPRALEWGGQRYEVQCLVKRWRTPAGPGFRVKVSRVPDSQSPISNLQSPISNLVDLQYLEAEDQWTMTVHTSS